MKIAGWSDKMRFVHSSVIISTGGSLGCAPGCDAEGREFGTPTGPTLRVFK